MTSNLFIEALIVGIILLLVSTPIMWGVKSQFGKDTNYYATTVFIGFMTHLIFEWSGMNKWYCKNGNACSATSHPASW